MCTLILSSLLAPALVLGSIPKPPSDSLLEQAGTRLIEARGLASEGKGEAAIALLEGIARRFGSHPSAALRKKALEALRMKGEILIEQDLVDACMGVTREILRRFAKDRDAGIRAQAMRLDADVAQRLCERAEPLEGREPEGTDSPALEGLLRHYGETKDPAIARWVASALVERALRRSSMGNGQAAIQDCDLVAVRFGGMQATDVHHLVNRALADKGWILRGAGRLAEANACYDEILRRNQAAAKDGLDEASIRALRFKGINLTELGRSEEALPLFDEALRRLQEDPRGQGREQEACLLINKGYALGLLNRRTDSFEVYDELLRRFERSTDGNILHSVSIALLNKGLAMEPGEAVFAFDKVIARFGDEPGTEMQEQVLMAFFSKGDALARLGRLPESEALLREALQEGGETIHKGELEDAAIHPCPLDEAFKTLVNRLWEERHPPSPQDKPAESFDHVPDGN